MSDQPHDPDTHPDGDDESRDTPLNPWLLAAVAGLVLLLVAVAGGVFGGDGEPAADPTGRPGPQPTATATPTVTATDDGHDHVGEDGEDGGFDPVGASDVPVPDVPTDTDDPVLAMLSGPERVAGEYVTRTYTWTWEQDEADRLRETVRPLVTDTMWDRLTRASARWPQLDDIRDGGHEVATARLDYLQPEGSTDERLSARAQVVVTREGDVMDRTDTFRLQVEVRNVGGDWLVDAAEVL